MVSRIFDYISQPPEVYFLYWGVLLNIKDPPDSSGLQDLTDADFESEHMCTANIVAD